MISSCTTLQAIVKFISNPLSASSTYLPGSQKTVDCHREMLVLFWKLILNNRGFFEYILREEDLTQVVVPIMYFILDGRKDESKKWCYACIGCAK